MLEGQGRRVSFLLEQTWARGTSHLSFPLMLKEVIGFLRVWSGTNTFLSAPRKPLSVSRFLFPASLSLGGQKRTVATHWGDSDSLISFHNPINQTKTAPLLLCPPLTSQPYIFTRTHIHTEGLLNVEPAIPMLGTPHPPLLGLDHSMCYWLRCCCMLCSIMCSMRLVLSSPTWPIRLD